MWLFYLTYEHFTRLESVFAMCRMQMNVRQSTFMAFSTSTVIITY